MPCIWAALYARVYSLSKALGFSPWQLSAAMGVYTALLLLWLWRSGRGRRLGLAMPRLARRGDLRLLVPMLMLPGYNLLFSERPAGAAVLLLLCAGVTEEVFFRGFLLRFLLERCGGQRAVFISAALFALFHAANFFTAADWGFTALQILSAAAAGLSFAASALVYKSILPAALCHILINVTGNGAVSAPGVLFLCASAMLFSSYSFISWCF